MDIVMKNNNKAIEDISNTGFGTIIFEYPNEISVESDYQKVFAKFLAPVSGIYNISLDARYARSGYTGIIKLYKVQDFNQLIYYASSSKSYSQIVSSYDKFALSNELAVGGRISDDDFLSLVEDLIKPIEIDITSTYTKYNSQIHCYKGEPVFIYAEGSSSSYYSYAKNIVITYGND